MGGLVVASLWVGLCVYAALSIGFSVMRRTR